MVTCLFVKTLTNWALAGLWKTGCDQKPAHSALLKISFIKRVREVLSMNWVGGSLHQLGGRSSSLIGWEVLLIYRVGGSLQLTWRGCWRRGRAGQRRRAPPGTWRISFRCQLYSEPWFIYHLTQDWMMFLSQNMKKLLLHTPKILLDTAENAMGMATSQPYLWKPVLCLSRPGVSRMNSTPMFPWQNVMLTRRENSPTIPRISTILQPTQ